MCYAILMPRNGAAHIGLLDENHVVKRHEIVAVDRSGNRQQLWMAIHAQARRHVLAHAAHAQYHIRGRVAVGRWLGHFAGVATITKIRAARRIRQRLDQRICFTRGIKAKHLSALCINLGIGGDRRALQHIACVTAQRFDFCRVDDAFKNIKSMLPVCRQNIRVQAAIRIEAHGAAMIEFARAAHASLPISGHARCMFGPCKLNTCFRNGTHGALPIDEQTEICSPESAAMQKFAA